MKIKNISFTIEDGYIEFSFDVDGQTGVASLQLPHTPDSQHTINWNDYDLDDPKQVEIFEKLSDFYFDAFEDGELAAASVLLGCRVDNLQEIKGFYVAFTDEEATLIKESSYRSYYNSPLLFEKVDPSDLQVGEDEFINESELIEEAKALRDLK